MAEPWRLRGTVLIACKCDYGCPCNFNAPPTHGDCEGGWIWYVEEGRYGDVPLDGLTFSVLADWPAAIHEGNGRAVALVDERADERQRDAVATLVGGEAGGPWAVFAPTYALEGPRFAPHELVLAGDRTRLRAGDVLELELEPIRNPVTGAEVHPGLVLPEGLVIKEGSLCSSRTFRVSDGVSYDHSGRYAAFAPFAYEGP